MSARRGSGMALRRLLDPVPLPAERRTLAVAAVAAAVMFAVASSLAILLTSVTGELGYFQPSETPGASAELLAPSRAHPHAAIAYFTLDTAFVISFTMVFVGLYAVTRPASAPFARLALGAGVFTGLADAFENALYWAYAMQAASGVPLDDPAAAPLYVLTNLKLVGFFATYFGFALLFPRRDLLATIAVVAMLLPPTVGLVSLGVRELADVRPVLFASPALPLAIVFARGYRAAAGRAKLEQEEVS